MRKITFASFVLTGVQTMPDLLGSTLSALPEGLQVRPEHGPPIGRIDAYGGRVAHDALGHRCSGRRQVLCGYGTKVGGSCVEQPLPKGLPHRGKQVSKHASKQASK